MNNIEGIQSFLNFYGWNFLIPAVIFYLFHIPVVLVFFLTGLGGLGGGSIVWVLLILPWLAWVIKKLYILSKNEEVIIKKLLVGCSVLVYFVLIIWTVDSYFLTDGVLAGV